jgi:hypothetical protein
MKSMDTEYLELRFGNAIIQKPNRLIDKHASLKIEAWRAFRRSLRELAHVFHDGRRLYFINQKELIK